MQLLLRKEEWHTFECKRALISPSKLLETAVAFANTDGGTIAVGLEDPKKATGRNRVTGISEGASNLSDFLKLLEKDIDPPLPPVQREETPITNRDNKSDHLALFRIPKSDTVHSLKNGDTFVRRGQQNVKIGAREIERLQYEKGARHFEDEASTIQDITELDEGLLKKYIDDTGGAGLDIWQFLKDNGLAVRRNGTMVLTKAGVLLFGKNPSVLLKGKCGIKISHYFGTAPTYSGNPNFVEKPFTIEGPLLKQIEVALGYFRSVVKKSPPKLRGATFRPSILIPEWAFQESVTNAVVHRNYSIADDIHIRFFDDRVEIESPGTYPGHVTANNLRTERFARNPLIQRTLNRFEDSPNLDIGEGVDRMFKIMKEHNLYEPLYLPPNIRPNSVLLMLLNLQRLKYWDTVSKYLDKHFIIANQKAREITDIQDSVEMSRLLKGWVKQGLLQRLGSSKKAAYYKKPNVELSRGLFSRPLKIKRK